MFDYISSNEFTNSPSVDITEIEGMIKLAQSDGVKFIFNLKPKEKEFGEENVFFFPLNGFIYKLSGKNYETLEDFKDAKTGGFDSSAEYYEARGMGFKTYEEFKLCKDMGVSKKDEYEDAKRAGFAKGFDAFVKKIEVYKLSKYITDIPEKIENSVQLFHYAEEKGFKMFKDFEDAFSKGFSDYRDWHDSVAKGFRNALEFYTAVAGGFNDSKEYDEARKYMISTKKEFDDYRFLKNNIKEKKHDEYQLVSIISTVENGKKVKFSELREKLNAEQAKYIRSFDNGSQKRLPIWYTLGIDTDEKMRKFLKENKSVKRLGFFDEHSEKFEVFRLSKDKIYVDASNVAYYLSTDENKVAQFGNIVMIIHALKEKGFSNITAIADASLRHKAKDDSNLKILRKEIQYIEVPAHTSADDFIIQSARKEFCLIISNDTFNDWKVKDKWIANNIDDIRQPFLISNGKVVFSGMDKYFNNEY